MSWTTEGASGAVASSATAGTVIQQVSFLKTYLSLTNFPSSATLTTAAGEATKWATGSTTRAAATSASAGTAGATAASEATATALFY